MADSAIRTGAILLHACAYSRSWVTRRNKTSVVLVSLDGWEEWALSFFDPASCHSIADLTKFAQRTARLELPVIDKTGLTGLYNMKAVDWSAIIPGPRQPEDPTKPTFADVLGRLGLKLETQKAIVEMLFVDHVEVPTTEN